MNWKGCGTDEVVARLKCCFGSSLDSLTHGARSEVETSEYVDMLGRIPAPDGGECSASFFFVAYFTTSAAAGQHGVEWKDVAGRGRGRIAVLPIIFHGETEETHKELHSG